MASVRLALEGLDAFRALLERLPVSLNAEARNWVIEAAKQAAAELKAAYPSDNSGNLRRGIRLKVVENEAATIATVVSAAQHAHLWEFGTQVRRTQRALNRGAMPAQYNKGLVGIASRKRRDLNRTLVDIVERAGFDVSGLTV